MNETPISVLNYIQEEYGKLVATVLAECFSATLYTDPTPWSAEFSTLCRFVNRHLGINLHTPMDALFRVDGNLRWLPPDLREAAREWLEGRRF